MNIWFDYEDLKRAIGNWTLPDTPYYYNTRRWNNRIRNEHNPEKEEEEQQNPKVNNKKNMKKKKNSRQQSTSSRPSSQHRGYNSEYEEDRRQDYRREGQHSYYKDQDYKDYNDYNWERENSRALRDHYAEPNQPRSFGAGRRSELAPYGRDEPRDPGYQGTGARPHPQRDHRRDSSRGRSRERRYSDRSSSRERKGNYGANRARRLGYGKSGRS